MLILTETEVLLLRYYLSRSLLVDDADNTFTNVVALEAAAGNLLAQKAMAVREMLIEKLKKKCNQ